VVDSFSHEWAGDGGCCEMQEAELDRMAGDDWRKREAVKIAAWIKPKMAHKRLVTRLLQCRAHLIFCFRAEPKIEMVKDPQTGKMVVQPKRVLGWASEWIPVTEKNFLFEMTASFVLAPDHPGYPIPIKLQEQHKGFFPLDAPISEISGQRLAAWATPTASTQPLGRPGVAAPGVEPEATSGGGTGGTPVKEIMRDIAQIGAKAALIEPPDTPGTPVDDWVGAFGALTTLDGGAKLWKDALKVKDSFTAREWLRIVVAKNDAKARLTL